MAKAKGPFGDSQIPTWLSGARTDVPAKPPLIGLEPNRMHSVNVRIICYLLAIDYKTEVYRHYMLTYIFTYRHYITHKIHLAR
jgi:hypothetical protein